MAEREDKDELDLNDPRWDETYEGDPEADYNAFVVIPDGIHQARIEYQEDKNSYGKEYQNRDGDDKMMLIAPLQVVIQEDGKPYTGQKMRDWVNSLISFRNKTSVISHICNLAGRAHAPGIGNKALKTWFDNVIAAEPLVKVRTEWEGNCEKCRKAYLEENPEGMGAKALKKKSNEVAHIAALDGMRNWPEDGKGGFKSETKCPVCHEDIQARPVVKKYLALK